MVIIGTKIQVANYLTILCFSESVLFHFLPFCAGERKHVVDIYF